MSDFHPHSPSRAAAVKAEAASWLARVHSGDCNEACREDLDAWLGQSRAHKAAFWRVEAAWDEAERLRVLRAPLLRSESVGPRRNYTFAKVAVAAVFATIIGVAGYLQSQSPPLRSYATSVGGRQVLNLSDGSKIELNTNTVLRIISRAGERQVWLDRGEAFFQIQHDAAHPFTVTVGEHKITDLGTKFSVRQDGERLRVMLVEGKARLDSTDIWTRRQSVELSPGDVAIATANSLSLVRKSDRTLGEELGWRRGVLIFDRTSLSAAAAEINRYNTQKLVIEDPSVAKLTLDGTFPVHAVPEFIEVAQAVFGLRVERRGDHTFISK